MSLEKAFRDTRESDIIQIKPYHMNTDIVNNMLKVLKNKIEQKCNENGFVEKVYKIINYSYGEMPPENLNGAANYVVEYDCRLYDANPGKIYIGLIRMVNPELVCAII
jgi:DNA-directed RNA polymerase subunit E'/Rpb7